MKLEVPLRFLSELIEQLTNPSFIANAPRSDIFSKQVLSAIAQAFRDSTKLILPEGGLLLPHNTDRSSYAEYMRMPFPIISAVYSIVDKKGLETNNYGIMSWVAVRRDAVPLNSLSDIDPIIIENPNAIVIIPVFTAPEETDIGKVKAWTAGIRAILVPNVDKEKGTLPFDIYASDLAGESITSEANDLYHYAKTVLGIVTMSLTDVLLAFNIERGVRYEDLPVTPEVSHKLNNKRAKRGKVPLYQYRILDLNADRIVYNKDKTTVHTHASPRAHMRRAHIRHLENKAVWVRECMVNAGVWEHVDNPIYVGRKAHG